MRLIGKNLGAPDETDELPMLLDEVVHVGGYTVTRETLEPGWRWSEHARPQLGGEWCDSRHVGVTVSGRWGVALPDGERIEFGPGDVFDVPAGHDSWTIGEEPCVTIEWAPDQAPSLPAR
jgi:hypothetical protein